MEKIAVIGIGRIGICLALNLERSGYQVLGVDVSADRVDAINNRTFESSEPFVAEYLADAKSLVATTQLEDLVKLDVRNIFVVVSTPSLPDGTFDHGNIDAIVDQLCTYGRRKDKCHFIINSTILPGYSDTLQERLGDLNYTVSYNPEFVARGSIIKDQQLPEQVLIGEGNTEAGHVIEDIYHAMCRNKPLVCRMSRISAEIAKLARNCFLTTKIAFANSVGDLALMAGAEPEKILGAIGADSRIGNKYLQYGFGYGGPSFPRDNRAFVRFAHDKGYNILISEATDMANATHADFLSQDWLKRYKEEDVIVFYSVTYKKGTDIIEESQPLKLALELARAGRKVKIREEVPVIKKLIDLYGNLFTYEVHGN